MKKGSLVLRTTYMPGGLIYKEGIDYEVDYKNGTITRSKNSRIPDYSTNCLYGQKTLINPNSLDMEITNGLFGLTIKRLMENNGLKRMTRVDI